MNIEAVAAPDLAHAPAAYRDPRPDLSGGDEWSRVLRLSYAHDGTDPVGLHAALMLVRCHDVVTLEDDVTTLRMNALPHELITWQELRALLLPNAAALTRILREARQ